MNKVRDYLALEREYVTGTMSLRELCQIHDITAHSSVVTQARKHPWQEKREAYQTKASESSIEKHAERMADRLAEIHDHALDAIDEAIAKFRSDLRSTKAVRQPDGGVSEEPTMRLMPKDLAILIDRLQALFDRPTHISEQHDLSIKSELSIDALNRLVELTRGRAAPPTSPMPRTPRRLDD